MKTMTSALADFQDGFAKALLATPEQGLDGLSPALRALAQQPGFAVYRNTVMKGWIDALQANHPTVLRLVGEDWFRAAAALHARAQPPQDARLVLYGAGFHTFLRHFEPAAQLPYLPDVAYLDRLWTECHTAPECPTLAPQALTPLTPAQLGCLVLRPHPAARWAWFEGQPIYTIWQRNRLPPAQAQEPGAEPAAAPELNWVSEGALLTRPGGQVQWTALDAAGCAFLDACACGQTLAQAANAALACQADADLARLMATLLDCGAVAAGRATEPGAAPL